MDDALRTMLLPASRRIDAVTATVGRAAAWLVLAACLISVANAFLRYGAHVARPMLLDLPVLLFAGIVLGGPTMSLMNPADLDTLLRQQRSVDAVVRFDAIEDRHQAVDQRVIERVEFLGPVQGHQRDRPARLREHHVVAHRTAITGAPSSRPP